MTSVQILKTLIRFDTVSRNSNMALMRYIETLLGAAGITATLIPNQDGSKANLLATIGPVDRAGGDRAGVMLSGHTDVVPVEGQNWTKQPFEMTCSDGKYFGRGTTDMKGFVACAITAALKAQARPLKSPLHLAFSYDEEIGCQGVGSLIDLLSEAPLRPAMCIVGEPTGLAVATGHKGKIALKARCIGREGHSALAPMALNALHLGCDLVTALRDIQSEIKLNYPQDGDYDVPYTTVHTGRINGGVALNIVPNLCEVDFEIRNLAEDDPKQILKQIKVLADQIVVVAQTQAKEAAITFETTFSYPGLNTSGTADVVRFVTSLTGSNKTKKVAFGTEGGLFFNRLDIPTVVCGPGSMMQGHKPDEYIEVSQIDRCDAMLDRLIDRLCDGL
jgi:acetylornithine deacetylase